MSDYITTPQDNKLTVSTVSQAETANGTLKLLDQHYRMLHDESAISEDVIKGRGYFSITTSKQAMELGFSPPQTHTISERHPALVIPLYNPDGTPATYVLRPDAPRSVDDKKNGKLRDGTYPQKVFKYEMVKGSGNVLDCHPLIVPHLGDPTRPIIFTEGAKKADSLIAQGFLAINLAGVWGWRGTNAQQGKTALAGFDDIALNGRKCILLFDSDVRDNDNIKSALRRFKGYLESKRAVAIPVYLPPTSGEKIGIDDYFASGHTAADLDALIVYFETFAADLGETSQRRNWITEQHIDLFREWGYIFRLNDMNEAIDLNGEQMNDTKMNVMEARLRDEKIPVKHAKNSMVVYADLMRYHPIKDYLTSLEWNGKDNIETLAAHFTDKQLIFFRWLNRWLIGCVAKVMGDGRNQNFMLALDGPQGIGKSYFAHWICPLDKYFLESPLNPDDKDTLIRLMSNFIWEVGELGSVTRRADREALKRIISMQEVTVRPPYGHFDIIKPATASFIGTVNNESGFLNDPTGNRRYASCTLTAIDWNYTKLDVNQVWAHAVALYQQGEPWELRGDEAALRDKINADYQQEEPLEDLILTQFEIDPDKAENLAWRMTTPQILGMMGLDKDNRSLAMRLAAVLKREGLEKSNPLPVKEEGLEKSNPPPAKEERRKARFWLGLKYHG